MTMDTICVRAASLIVQLSQWHASSDFLKQVFCIQRNIDVAKVKFELTKIKWNNVVNRKLS